ncbi:TRAP transporter permease [Desulfallas sp. Bu1-1]|uniref:TRAP transporter permease n=1 Tax=Desulfallas sp. Bu1-1 TaxID=2787620 RepID=UPI0018A01DA6|nr:TRAP transporter permease [Desulfallas sp. Bu1-1]MBF7084528.1 TRAP transporter permease [Desulfallas sp. Bu1-1]
MMRLGNHINYLVKIVKILSIGFALFQIYTAAFGQLPAFQQRLAHLTFALSITFLVKPISSRKIGWRAVDVLLAVITFVIGIYGFNQYESLSQRVGDPSIIDVVMGLALVVLLLEGTRRLIGWFLPAIALLFIFYARYGRLFPEPFTNAGYDWTRIANDLYLTTNGIFGTPLGASTSLVAIFVIFAAFLERSGAGMAFIELAQAFFGRIRGGPAKIAVVASGFMGMISGSAVANVVGTGSFTIPLMKRIGLKPEIAGGVESVASTGSQLMPPIMGAAAFIMAEVMGEPYVKIVIAAIIPAVMYYLSLFIAVDSEALKIKASGINEVPNKWSVLVQKWIMFVPLVVLIYFLVVLRATPTRSAIIALVLIPLLGLFNRQERFNFNMLLECLERSGRNLLEVALTCACAGIIVGVLMLTGLGLNLTSIMIDLAGGKLIILLVLTMVSSIILGMGLPTSACYVILAVLVAPALVTMGVEPISAHMFILFFGVIANITPPVALAAYAGAAIAESNPFKTGWIACRLGIAGFIIPFYLIFRPQILLGAVDASLTSILFNIFTLLVGICAINGALSGAFLRPINSPVLRIFLGVASILLFFPLYIMDVIGYVLVALVAAILIFEQVAGRTLLSRQRLVKK